jgi:hypothetical protein
MIYPLLITAHPPQSAAFSISIFSDGSIFVSFNTHGKTVNVYPSHTELISGSENQASIALHPSADHYSSIECRRNASDFIILPIDFIQSLPLALAFRYFAVMSWQSFRQSLKQVLSTAAFNQKCHDEN